MMAGWWERRVVPGLVRCGCSQAMLAELRRKVVPRAAGDVLELGVGAGANFGFYDLARVRSLTGVEPSPELLAMAQAAASGLRTPCALHGARGEALPFADASFDTVVTTFTLCSVEDPAEVLAQARRVLRPGGRLLFVEHARSPDPGPRRWQARIEPVWKRLAGNCHLTRPAHAAVEAAGLAVERGEGFYLPRSPRWLGWIELGEAVKGRSQCGTNPPPLIPAQAGIQITERGGRPGVAG